MQSRPTGFEAVSGEIVYYCALAMLGGCLFVWPIGTTNSMQFTFELSESRRSNRLKVGIL